MPRTTTATGDPVNELYDHGADLVEAARALRDRAAAPAAARAVPAVAGCIEAALRDLAIATAELEQAAESAADETDDPRAEGRRARMRHGFANLEAALDDAAVAAAAARALAARAVPPS